MTKLIYKSLSLPAVFMFGVLAWGSPAHANFEIAHWATDKGVQVYHVQQVAVEYLIEPKRTVAELKVLPLQSENTLQ